MWDCSSCRTAFNTRRDLIIHREQQHAAEPSQSYKCGECSGYYTTSRSLVRHLRTIHNSGRYLKCLSCQTFFSSQQKLSDHCATNHDINNTLASRARVQNTGNMSVLQTRQSIRGFFKTFRFKPSSDEVFDSYEYFVANELSLIGFIDSHIDSQTMKLSLCVSIDFLKPITLDKTTSYFTSSMETVSRKLTSEEYYSLVDQIMTQINIFCTGGSGWVIDRMKSLDVKINKYSPLRPATYIPTPKKLESLRRSILNIKNLSDSFCFIYCVLAALFPVRKNQQRPSSYRSHFDDLNFNKRTMPMPLSYSSV